MYGCQSDGIRYSLAVVDCHLDQFSLKYTLAVNDIQT